MVGMESAFNHCKVQHNTVLQVLLFLGPRGNLKQWLSLYIHSLSLQQQLVKAVFKLLALKILKRLLERQQCELLHKILIFKIHQVWICVKFREFECSLKMSLCFQHNHLSNCFISRRCSRNVSAALIVVGKIFQMSLEFAELCCHWSQQTGKPSQCFNGKRIRPVVSAFWSQVRLLLYSQGLELCSNTVITYIIIIYNRPEYSAVEYWYLKSFEKWQSSVVLLHPSPGLDPVENSLDGLW